MTKEGVRRNINSFQTNQKADDYDDDRKERQRYFWCLKMLCILPPLPPPSPPSSSSSPCPAPPIDEQDRVFQTPGYNNPPTVTNIIKPKCLYDQLIASYYSSKMGLGDDDQTYFYGLYHRHLIVYFEFLLNYADQMLKLDLETFETRFVDLAKDKESYFGTVLTQYQALGLTSKVMAHYWNPTNYKNISDLAMPPQLADKDLYDGDYDDMDNLFFVVRGYYPYQVDASTRWQEFYTPPTPTQLRTDYFPQLQNKLAEQQYICPTAYSYTAAEIGILNRTLTPRPSLVAFNIFYEFFIQLCDFGVGAVIPNTLKHCLTLSNVNLNNNYKLHVYSLGQKQLNANFGYQPNTTSSDVGDIRLKSLTYSYFSEDEIKQLFDYTDSVQYAPIRNLRHYNNSLAYYQLAYGLYNFKVHEFMRSLSPKNGQPLTPNSVNEPDLRYVGVDGPYSIYSLMFFPYHSFVDAQMQLSIRLNNCWKNVCETIEYLKDGLKDRQINEYFDWSATAESRNNAVVSKVQQYLINNDNKSYRTSMDLDDIYSNPNYFACKLSEEKNMPNDVSLRDIFASYNPNYCFDLFQQKDRSITAMPPQLKYIEDMKCDVIKFKQVIDTILSKQNGSDEQNSSSRLQVFGGNPSGGPSINQQNFINNLIQKGFVFTLTPPQPKTAFSLGTIAQHFQTQLLIDRLNSVGNQLNKKQEAIIRSQDYKKQISIYAQVSQLKKFLAAYTRHKKQQPTNVYWTKTRKVKQTKQIFRTNSSIDSENDVVQFHHLKAQQTNEKHSHFIHVKGAERVFFSITYRTLDQQINGFQVKIEGISRKNTGQIHRTIIQTIGEEDLVQKAKNIWQFDARELFENLAIEGVQHQSGLDGYTYTDIAVGITIKNNRQHFRRQILQHYSEIFYSLEIAQNGNGFSAVAKETTNATRVQEVKQEK